mgnify:FL=1|tara:strand:- start:9310 stop:9600 length:291 start_codon:yes stop_codon:yes gene_type:complete
MATKIFKIKEANFYYKEGEEGLHHEEVIVEESEQKFYKILETTKTVSQDYYDSEEKRNEIYQEKLLKCEKKNNVLINGDSGFVEFISDLETVERDV